MEAGFDLDIKGWEKKISRVVQGGRDFTPNFVEGVAGAGNERFGNQDGVQHKAGYSGVCAYSL
ncbi:hypothetical protein D3C87_2049710 [compost metagenome]